MEIRKYVDETTLNNVVSSFDEIKADKSELVGQATPEGGEIFNDYENNSATGLYSHAEG